MRVGGGAVGWWVFVAGERGVCFGGAGGVCWGWEGGRGERRGWHDDFGRVFIQDGWKCVVVMRTMSTEGLPGNPKGGVVLSEMLRCGRGSDALDPPVMVEEFVDAANPTIQIMSWASNSLSSVEQVSWQASSAVASPCT